ncbi:MAG: anti-sigma factor [Bacteroidetes bacterium]|nr:MAG: anti-sigma factor [Bacteroidota bacterium]
MNEQHLNLIQAEVDGLNSDSESEHLRNLIEENPTLRASFDELQAVKLAIESLVEIEPPPTLRASIMNAIPEREPEHASVTETTSWWASIASLVKSPKPVSLAYAFSLGLIVAFVVSTVLMPPPSSSNTDQFLGSIGAVSLSGFETIAEFAIEEEEEEDERDGSIKVHRSATLIVIEFTWDSSRPVTARITYDEEYLDYTGYTGTNIAENSSSLTTRTEDGELTMSSDEGRLKQYVTLTVRDGYEGDGKMNFNVTSGGSSLLTRSLWVRKVQ